MNNIKESDENTKIILQNAEAFKLWKETIFFDISYDIIDYCRNNCQVLLNTRDSTNEINDLLMEYIDMKDPFILTVESESDEDETSFI